jgi:hypothetical protein
MKFSSIEIKNTNRDFCLIGSLNGQISIIAKSDSCSSNLIGFSSFIYHKSTESNISSINQVEKVQLSVSFDYLWTQQFTIPGNNKGTKFLFCWELDKNPRFRIGSQNYLFFKENLFTILNQSIENIILAMSRDLDNPAFFNIYQNSVYLMLSKVLFQADNMEFNFKEIFN